MAGRIGVLEAIVRLEGIGSVLAELPSFVAVALLTGCHRLAILIKKLCDLERSLRNYFCIASSLLSFESRNVSACNHKFTCLIYIRNSYHTHGHIPAQLQSFVQHMLWNKC